MKHLFITSYLAGTKNSVDAFLTENFVAPSRLLVITTAGNVEAYTGYIDEGKKVLQSLGFELDFFDLANEHEKECVEKIKQAEGIVVTGGNTFYLLQELKKKRLESVLVDKIISGCPYLGESAGGIILAPAIDYVQQMDDPKQAPELTNYAGLDRIDFYPLPHYNEAPFKEEVHAIYQTYHEQLPIVPINNQQAISVKGLSRKIVSD